jgi:hypothetical protein
MGADQPGNRERAMNVTSLNVSSIDGVCESTTGKGTTSSRAVRAAYKNWALAPEVLRCLKTCATFSIAIVWMAGLLSAQDQAVGNAPPKRAAPRGYAFMKMVTLVAPIEFIHIRSDASFPPAFHFREMPAEDYFRISQRADRVQSTANRVPMLSRPLVLESTAPLGWQLICGLHEVAWRH